MLNLNEYEMMPVFPNAVYTSKTDISSEIYKFIESLDYYCMENNSGQLSYNTSILDEETLRALNIDIKSHIDTYVHQVLQVQDDLDFYVTCSWVTLHEHGDYSPSHLHSNSILSGTLYINIPKDDESLFQFQAPSFHKILGFVNADIKEHNIWNSSTCSIKPETGTILIFPSSLTHGTTPMTSTTENRYCLAFNVFVKGNIGNNINRLDL